MADARFRVGYRGRRMHEAFMHTIAEAPRVEVVSLDVPEQSLAAELAACHGYYVSSARDELPAQFWVTDELLARMPSLLLIATYGAGYDTVDVDACTRAGVALINQAGGNAEGVAEHALGMTLALLKRMPEAHAAMRAGAVREREAFMGRELAGRTIGIVGLGHVGTRVARLLRAFDCRVLAYDPYLDEDTCAERGAKKVDLPRLLAESDVVTVHCPLSDETRGMFGAPQYAAMRDGALFLNTARGGICDESALVAALDAGHLGGAGIDAWEREPPPADHSLLAHPAVIASVHTAGVTHESRTRVAEMAARAFVDAADGAPPPRLINPEIATRYRERWDAAFGAPTRVAH